MNNATLRFLAGSKRRKVLPIIIIMTMVSTGCYYDKGELLYPGSTVDCVGVATTFAHVKSIIAAKCNTSGCHNAGSASGGTVLETYDQIKAKADRIIQRVIVEKTMPPGTALSAAELAALQCWINAGTPNN
jgi:uncharacterized membrane protein